MTLAYLNSSLNPVIYCWKMRNIHHAIIDILRNISTGSKNWPWYATVLNIQCCRDGEQSEQTFKINLFVRYIRMKEMMLESFQCFFRLKFSFFFRFKVSCTIAVPVVWVCSVKCLFTFSNEPLPKFQNKTV